MVAWSRYAALRLQLLTLRVDRYISKGLAAAKCTQASKHRRSSCAEAEISCDYGLLLQGSSRLVTTAMTTAKIQPRQCSAVTSGRDGKMGRRNVVVPKAERAFVAARLPLGDLATMADWQFPFRRAHYPHRKLAICSRPGSTHEIANFQTCTAV